MIIVPSWPQPILYIYNYFNRNSTIATIITNVNDSILTTGDNSITTTIKTICKTIDGAPVWGMVAVVKTKSG